MNGINLISYFIMVLLVTGPTAAGPVAAGVCYAGCAAVVVACFTAAGFTFGTVPGSQIAAVPALTACNSAFGFCEAACVAALVSPTP
uniref:Putative secreted salivary peptide n=1 Tax=Rhodnius prolixus TaxID=13249 RepID=R4FPB4_RHOPR